ncbi:conserved hypothetical protein [Tenacibaculum maritimum]|uniref:TIGR02594 family protein n=1 Tax=Tenacibaculum maritimum TaxID=107401 RepID=UPI0012E5CB9F|nr:TIGR02594 family protein [Tenacibaculum maritimum]CAA0248867.1 conserved hypothetical protein [Tenacibaculum maritimum]
MNTAIITTALSQIGTIEIKGKKHNPTILKYFKEIGKKWVQTDETAWCSAFANWVAKTTGYPFSGKLTARSWLKIGQKITTPELGDVVVFWRESPESWKGHVGFFIRETPTHIYVLGGNQNNSVKISAYPKKRLLQYRRL